MLLGFTVENYRSFKNEATFTMQPIAIREIPDAIITTPAGNKLLRSAVLFGKNASGKSNFFRALHFMKLAVEKSVSTSSNSQIKFEPFSLLKPGNRPPTKLEVLFEATGTIYRYGFSFTRERIHSEWLYSYPKNRERKLFERTEDDIYVNPRHFSEGKILSDRTRKTTLFLSVVATFNGSVSSIITKWFSKLFVYSSNDIHESMIYTRFRLEDEKFRKKVSKFLTVADLGICDLEIDNEIDQAGIIKEIFNSDFAEVVMRNKTYKIIHNDIRTWHTVLDKKGKTLGRISFDLMEHESQGTIKFLSILGPVIDTLKDGGVLFIDELDSRLHPLIAQFILDQFNSPETNPNQAQLIFASHALTNLDKDRVRRDQVWFVDKDNRGESNLYCLSDIRDNGKIVRNDASLAREYMRGKFGAIPKIIDLESIN